MEFLNGINSCFLDVYIFAPFICAILIGALFFLKNPIHIRCLAKIFFTVQFFFSSFLLMGVEETKFSVLGVDFLFDKISSVFLFLLAFLFLLFLYFSKTFIQKMHRLFYSVFILVYALLNVVILADSIIGSLMSVFWFLLIFYFLSESFTKSKERKKIKYQLFFDISYFVIVTMLIGWDFARYFVLNHIDFNYSNIVDNLYHINDLSIMLAFLGFLILSFRFLGFIPIDIKTIKNSSIVNPFIVIFNNICSLLIGVTLLIKTYLSFNYLFYQEQEKIVVVLLINLVYFICLTFRKDNILKIALCVAPILLISAMFVLFLFDNSGLAAFIVAFLSIMVSLVFFYFIVVFLISKMQTLNLEEFKKIPNTSRNVRFFTILSILNLAKMPLLSMFSVFIIIFALIFSTNYDGVILNFSPYIILFVNFVLSLNLFNLIYKILIEPQENLKKEIAFSNHQIIPMILCVFVVVILTFCFQSFFVEFIDYINLESF